MQLTQPHPTLYQINTRVWASQFSRQNGGTATLEDFPEEEIERIARMGFDWVYLLGIWQTGEIGEQSARRVAGIQKEYRSALPDLSEQDICSSCFAITGYQVPTELGGAAALANLRQRLQRHGLHLMLDFIPNHTAIDHPWAIEHPDYYVPGTPANLAIDPSGYVEVETASGKRILAHGRDPYFPAWSDTLQINYGNPEVGAAMLGELHRAAGQCDGLRCDMAMLILPDVFQRTWGIQMQPFWPAAIQEVHQCYPGFLFMAEVYWDLEWTLQQQGFDYTYDKRLYDRLREQHALPVREHLRAGLDYQNHLARFIENHDEPRAAAVFPPKVHQAAAVITYFSPGLRFFHLGQLEGFQKRIPMQLCRDLQEESDPMLVAFYQRLLACLAHPALHQGAWQLVEPQPAWEESLTWENFICLAWHAPPGTDAPAIRHIFVVVNYSSSHSQCFVRLPFADLRGHGWHLKDCMNGVSYHRQGDDLVDNGLYCDLPPWGYHVFKIA